MLSVDQWARAFRPQAQPWLLLGKGPSYARLDEVPTDRFHLCALNHVVRERPVALAHAIDLEVVRDCAEAIEANADYLAMPYRPHVAFEPSEQTVPELLGEVPVLQRLEAAGRLVVYDLSSSEPRPGQPVVTATYFSAEAALDLLATAGAREVRSLGVDGGTHYASAFDDLASTTRLATGHASFDLQFSGIARTIRRRGVLYAPWHVPAPVRVFVGSGPADELPRRVLEYSVKRHASLSVEVRALPLPAGDDPAAAALEACADLATRCGHQGRAIYMDAATLVLGDLAELWTLAAGANPVLFARQPKAHRGARHGVLLLDCEQLEGRALDETTLTPELPAAWNSVEHREAGTRVLHYADARPWLERGVPHAEAWYATLREALDDGFLSRDLVLDAVRRGQVAAELPRWAGLDLPRTYHRLRAKLNPAPTDAASAKRGGLLKRLASAASRRPRLKGLRAKARDTLEDLLDRREPGPPRPGRLEREDIMDVAFEFAARSLLEGCYLEFGCYRGDSFLRAHTAYRRWSAYAERKGFPLRYRCMAAFDSFAGLPPLEEGDRLSGYDHAVSEGRFACDETTFRQRLRAAGVDEDVHLVAGFYRDSLTAETRERLQLPPAVVVHLDCDLYSSARDALAFCADLVQDGTVVLLDDYLLYRGHPRRGVRRAFHEWLDERGFEATEYAAYSWAGKAFIVHLPDGSSAHD